MSEVDDAQADRSPAGDSGPEGTVLYRVGSGVAILTFNRPEVLNAWTPAMSERYFDLLDQAAADGEVRAIVVTGAGRGFCAGMDIRLLRNVDKVQPKADPLQRKAPYTLSIPKPVIAAINGPCAGVGFALAAACDIRFAVSGAKLTTAFARRGLIAEDGLSWLLPRLVGLPNAIEILLSGRTLTSDEAYALGFIQRISPNDVASEAIRYAEELASECSPWAMAAMKWQLYRHQSSTLADAEHESRLLRDQAVAGPDRLEGTASFMDRRPARFEPLPPSLSFP
jgi:enoyl-CoA hydratase/carnithine racemase